jgi:hypothetical protein
MIPKFPKSMANQQITLRKSTGQTDDWGKPAYEPDQTINNCVFQPQTIYSGTNNNRQLVANAIVFLYAGVSSPMPVLSKDNYQSVITFEGHDYALQTIVDNRDPFSNELWSYELEVL